MTEIPGAARGRGAPVSRPRIPARTAAVLRGPVTRALLAVLVGCALTAWSPPPQPAPPHRYEMPRWPPPPHAHAGPPSAGSDGTGAGAGAARRTVAAVNRARADAGCAPVRLSAALMRAARGHSGHMARHRRLAHTGAGDSTPAERLRDAGFRARRSAEVIAAGPDTPQAAVSLWLASPPHRKALLTCGFTHAGVGGAAGRGGPWWTLDLAERR
ncbi:CAP domain-containing protein [Streptomyces longisporoflavus]|uniref:CAP domain-containing protein n=1 Tax=Streptomyces longisporoflavus TaxID=28044 RepID=A0ABW7QF38_9ACTN